MEKTLMIKDVHLRVSNIEKSVAFYQKVLGMQVVSQDETTAVLNIGTEAFLYLKKGMEMPFKSTGLFHFAILLPTEEDLGSLLNHFSKIGFYEVGAGDHIFSQALYFDDIDGNGIEVYADRPRSQWVYEGDGTLEAATLPVDVNRLLEISKNTKWMGLPKDSTLGHIHLQVNDLDVVEKVYVEALGFDILTRMPTALFISKDGYHHHIGANTWGGKDLLIHDSESIGMEYFTLEVKDLQSMIDGLEAHNILYTTIDKGIEVLDDNGIKVQIISE